VRAFPPSASGACKVVGEGNSLGPGRAASPSWEAAAFQPVTAHGDRNRSPRIRIACLPTIVNSLLSGGNVDRAEKFSLLCCRVISSWGPWPRRVNLVVLVYCQLLCVSRSVAGSLRSFAG
jgi:hypothetical protein